MELPGLFHLCARSKAVTGVPAFSKYLLGTFISKAPERIQEKCVRQALCPGHEEEWSSGAACGACVVLGNPRTGKSRCGLSDWGRHLARGV